MYGGGRLGQGSFTGFYPMEGLNRDAVQKLTVICSFSGLELDTKLNYIFIKNNLGNILLFIYIII